MNQTRKDSGTWIGICEFCRYKVIGSADEEKEALKILNAIHQEEKKECQGEILVAFNILHLSLTGQY